MKIIMHVSYCLLTYLQNEEKLSVALIGALGLQV